jgi:hypothetical protein
MNPSSTAPWTGLSFHVDQTARERLAQGIIVLGGACMAVGGVVGYALGYLEALRQRRDDRETQDR